MTSKKSYFAFRFLDAAVDFASKAISFEKENEIVNDEYYYNIFTSIILCVSFLESNINELFSMIEDKSLNVKNKEIIISLWKRGIPRTSRYSIIDKYEIVLDIMGVEKLDNSCNPYQNITALIKLRNSLVHYEPEWTRINDPTQQETRLAKELKGKFKLNPFVNKEREPFFPYLCLSGGCALWAIKNSIEFVLSFYKKLNSEIPFKNNYDRILNKMAKLTV